MRTKPNAKTTAVIIIALSMAQLIMTVDLTIMNVIVPTLVNEFKTTISTVQTAITLYALVMASLVLLGGKLSEIYGRKKMFKLGLTIYGTGSLITAFTPNVVVLIFGWSMLEGIGAALMMPAMLALISINFQGKLRAKALGITAGVAGGATALGPIIGGVLTTFATWRYAFIIESILAIIAIKLSKHIFDTPVLTKQKLDIKGAIMATAGLSLFVLGILQASTYGWLRATKPFVINNITLNPLGLSIVPFISGLGIIILWLFIRYSINQEKAGKPAVLKASLLKIPSLKSGLAITLATQLVLAGTLFILPLFLTIILGYTALETGIALFPVSITIIIGSVYSGKIADKISQIRTIQLGKVLILIGLGLLTYSISNSTKIVDLILPFIFIGTGTGFVFPVVQDVVLNSGTKEDSSQVSGLNYTYQQLGTSLGTALLGSVLLFSLGSNIVSGLEESMHFSPTEIKNQQNHIQNQAEFISDNELKLQLSNTTLNDKQATQVLKINSNARIESLKLTTSLAVAISLGSLFLTKNIKSKKA